MFEKLRLLFLVCRAMVVDRSFFDDVRTIAFETRENHARLEALGTELQRFFQELQTLRQELSVAREFSKQERQKILRRLEQIEQGLPPDHRQPEEVASSWVM